MEFYLLNFFKSQIPHSTCLLLAKSFASGAIPRGSEAESPG